MVCLIDKRNIFVCYPLLLDETREDTCLVGPLTIAKSLVDKARTYRSATCVPLPDGLGLGDVLFVVGLGLDVGGAASKGRDDVDNCNKFDFERYLRGYDIIGEVECDRKKSSESSVFVCSIAWKLPLLDLLSSI